MRWEDLISEPVATIRQLAAAANLDVTSDFARKLWAKLDHVNLTQAHKHNYRNGAGVVGDWKRWVVNEHLEIARQHGLEEIAVELGYGAFERLDESRYTPFQRRAADFIRRGEVHREFPDSDLFTFAFNKSNLVSDKFPFRRRGWREHTSIERSIFRDEALESVIWDVAEDATRELNEFLRDYLESVAPGQTDVLPRLQALRRRHEGGLGSSSPERFAAAFRAAEREVRGVPLHERLVVFSRRALGRLRRMGTPAATEKPRLIEHLNGYDILFFKGVYYGLPQALGPVRIDSPDARRLPGVIDGTTLESVRHAIAERN
jgi:hypothetical protein